MHINEALLLAYQDAGATSSNLTEAEYQALVANGAADGKWHTFLRTAGWTGCLDEMMYAYLGDKGYAGTLSERLYQAAVALDLFGGYTPADEFTGGVKGWLYDGLLSAFLQSAGGSAAGNGDPLGSVQDLSGNGNDILQATGGAKPTNTVTGGINAISCASSKYMECTLASAVSEYRTVVYVICIKATTPGEAYPLLMGSGGTFDGIYNQTPTVAIATIQDNNANIGSVSCESANTPYIVIYKKYDDAGTKRVNVKVYRLSNGTLRDDKTYAAPSTNGVDLIDIGYPTPQPAFQIPFHMGIDGAPDLTNVLTYIYGKFAGWAP